MASDAYRNNEKLFPLLRQGLTEESKFVLSANKLSAWMSVDKAFYTSARPWIVGFLETAQATLCRTCGITLPGPRPFHISQCPPQFSAFVEAYRKMVQTVWRFDHLFIELDLRKRLEMLFRSVDLPQAIPPSLSMPTQDRVAVRHTLRV
ncbi:hypothetical protein BDW22DRAFT_129432 [Trametopsis cervina]|nr:hypothetical protein BDW22DRAFT_129432 [Trametopsis cervina]